MPLVYPGPPITHAYQSRLSLFASLTQGTHTHTNAEWDNDLSPLQMLQQQWYPTRMSPESIMYSMSTCHIGCELSLRPILQGRVMTQAAFFATQLLQQQLPIQIPRGPHLVEPAHIASLL